MVGMSAILEYRIDNGLTRQALADTLGVDPATLWRWEKDHSRIAISKLAEVERLTGIPRAKLRPDLFGGAA